MDLVRPLEPEVGKTPMQAKPSSSKLLSSNEFVFELSTANIFPDVTVLWMSVTDAEFFLKTCAVECGLDMQHARVKRSVGK